MKTFDTFLTILLPSLILLHLLVAPYTKVEESFNLQAAHDIISSGIPTRHISERLQTDFDHVTFSGAVPRTFLGAVVLSGLSQPVLAFTDHRYGQLVTRSVLGILNAFALLRYRANIHKAFGRLTARWFMLLLSGQFHVLFYATRTLPNMFAFGLTTLAFSSMLPIHITKQDGDHVVKQHKLSIYYFVLAGVVFRSEIALLLATHLVYLLITSSTPLTPRAIAHMGIRAAIVSLLISVPIDSYFWQRPIWPELSGFIFNAVQGKSSEWGTSPMHAYFSNFLPKLLLNPMIMFVGIPLSIYLPTSRQAALGLVVPNLAFVVAYSLQPHKEARFIIYVVPPLTAAASIAAAYMTTHRRNLGYRVLYLLFIASIPMSMIASTSMLFISSLNYPGGEALYTLHDQLLKRPVTHPIHVHLDVASCMTGISRFQQDHPTPPFHTAISKRILGESRNTTINFEQNLVTIYDKTEDEQQLLEPKFWTKFDYLITSRPERVIGNWKILSTVYGYAGIEFLRPGQVPTEKLPVHSLQYAELADGNRVFQQEDISKMSGGMKTAAANLEGYMSKIKRLGMYGCLREVGRLATGGWWIGPRMEAKIWVLERAK